MSAGDRARRYLIAHLVDCLVADGVPADDAEAAAQAEAAVLTDGEAVAAASRPTTWVDHLAEEVAVGQRVRITAPGSGYDGIQGTVVDDYRSPGEPGHQDALLVSYGPGREVVLPLHSVEGVS